MNIRQKLTLWIAAIFMVTLTIVGITYAYFVTRVIGENNIESTDIQTGLAGDIVYKDVNGPVILKNILPGVTEYYHFSVANLGELQQPFELFLNSSPVEDKFTTTETTGGETVEYTYGEFIHSVTGSNDDIGVTTENTGCYRRYAKMSSEAIGDDDKTYKELCFSNETTSKYNNIKITLYKLADSTIDTKTLYEDTQLWDFTAKTDPFININYETVLKDYGEGANKIDIPSQINYATRTDLIARIDIPGNAVYNYVLKVEYLKATNGAEEPTYLIQNAENLAALNIKVDIEEL